MNNNFQLKNNFPIVHCSLAYCSLAYCSLFIGLLFIVHSPINAQSLSLSISPPLIELTVQPGRSVTFSYQLTNNSENELALTPALKKFVPVGDSGQIDFQSIDKTNPISLFFESEERFNVPFTLAVGQTRQLVLKLVVDPNALEKDYYQTLLFSTITPNTPGTTQTSTITQIGSNLLITVSQGGNPFVSGNVVSITSNRIIDSFSPLDFSFILGNTGNTLYKPFGKAIISGWFNQKQEVTILEQNVLANSSRRFTVEGIKPSLAFGVFTITVKFQPNGIPPFVDKTTIVYYLPYKLMALLFIVILIVWGIRHKRNKTKGINQNDKYYN